MRNAKLLLEKLTELYPPIGEAHHNLVIDNGSLVVTVVYGNHFYPFTFTEEEDFDEPVEELVRQIQELMDPVVQCGPSAWPVNRKTAVSILTDEERTVIDLLAVAYNGFVGLEVLHDWHQQEFMHAIHAAQHLVLARPGLRELSRQEADGEG